MTRGSATREPERNRPADTDAKERLRKDRDQALERGLEESFPGSDPVSVVQPSPSIYDKNQARRG